MATLHIENINKELIKNYQITSLEAKQKIKQLIETVLRQQLTNNNLSQQLDENSYPVDFFDKTFGSIPDIPERELQDESSKPIKAYQPQITKGDKSIDPSSLFGIWKDNPRDLEDIRKKSWQRDWNL